MCFHEPFPQIVCNLTTVRCSLSLELGVNELCFEGSRLLSLYLIIMPVCARYGSQLQTEAGNKRQEAKKEERELTHLFSHILKLDLKTKMLKMLKNFADLYERAFAVV